MNLEEYIDFVNKKPKFKVLIFLLLALPSFQNYSQLQNALIAVYLPKFSCLYNSSQSQQSHIPTDQCYVKVNNSQTFPCRKWNFSSEPFGVTEVSEFSLVCDKANYRDLLLLVWYSTSLIAPIAGILSDKYGRRKVALVHLVLETVMMVCLSLSPNFASSFVIRLFLGISGSGLFICYVWLMEMVNPDFRTFSGSFYWIYGCLAYTTFPAIVYYTQNWRITQLLSATPSIFYLLLFFVPESPRWLLVKGRKSEAIAVIEKIRIFNNIPIEMNYNSITVNQEKQTGIWTAFRSQKFLLRTMVAFLIQFSTFIFWGAVTMDLDMLSKNKYINIFLMGLMEIPSLFVAYLSLKYLRRKKAILLYGGIGASLFLLSIFLSRSQPIQATFRIVIGCIAKVSIATVIQITLVFVTELFPTTHRTFGLVFIQIANFLSFTGAVYVNKLTFLAYFVPMSLYVLLFWLSYAVGELVLPETKDLPLPDTIHDVEMLIRGKEYLFLKHMRERETEKLNPSLVETSFEKDEDTPLINN